MMQDPGVDMHAGLPEAVKMIDQIAGLARANVR
jgi:hypothetical protein